MHTPEGHTTATAPVHSGMLGPGHTWTTDLPGRDAFLCHHSLQTKPLLPAAIALALAAEAAHRAPPISFRHVIFHAPMYAPEAPTIISYRFVARPPSMSIVVADTPSCAPGQPPAGMTCANFELQDCAPDLSWPALDHLDTDDVPYGPYIGTAALAMSGPFVALQHLRAHGGVAQARYRPRLLADRSTFPEFTICAALLDAMIQIGLVSLGTWHGGMNQLLPSSCSAVHIDTSLTDRQLLARHPAGLELRAQARSDRGTDITSWATPRRPIAQIIGLRATVLPRRNP